MVRAATDSRSARKMRDRDAPGLSRTKRFALGRLWIKQGRLCAYCDAASATTVDHVVPLVRGGTNYEGNLAPCCKPCNSSKGGLTLVEWRSGKRLPGMTTPLPWSHPRPILGPPRPRRFPTSDIYCRTCAACDKPFVSKRAGRRVCSSPCIAELNRIRARDAYRTRVGIPLDAPLYVRVA